MRTVNVKSSVTTIAEKVDKTTRKWILIQNDSDVDMFLCFDGSTTTLTANNGFRLKAGVALELRSTEDTEEGNNAILGIHGSTGDKVVRIQEGA